MAEPAATTQTEVVKVLDKIKQEMMERRQFRAQQNTNKELSKVNKNLEILNSKSTQSAPDKIELKFPTVSEIVGGFARVSPIFTRDYSTWMRDTVDVGLDANAELEKISNRIERLGEQKAGSSVDLPSEYLDLISDQLKSANDDSLKRMDSQGDSLTLMNTELTRIADGIEGLQSTTDQIAKGNRDQLVRLFSVENTVGRVGGLVVGTLKRIFEGDEKWREKDELRRAEEGKEGHDNPRAGSNAPAPPPAPDGGGSGILAAIAGMLGLGALKSFLGAPFKAVGKVLGKFFGMFSKIGEGVLKMLGPLGKVLKFLKVGPLVLISSIIDFATGFFNAKEILGKAKVSIIDRIQAGFTELIGGFGDLFDWVAKIFGFDTTVGKTIRDIFIAITNKPVEWLNGILDWISNDLFAGIGRGTALTEIPGKLADNLQSEMTKLVDWVTNGISDFIDEGIGIAEKIIDDMKKGFGENVKKPFFNMLNAITNAMFDIVDKFIEIIPDALGGETARKKMAEARQAMLVNQDESAPSTPAASDAQPTSTVDTKPLTPLPPEQTKTGEITKTDQLKDAYGTIGGGSLGNPAPVQGRTASNIEQMKSAYAKQAPSVVMPVQQNVNNAKQVTTNNNFNSTSLEPSNQTDKSRILWDW